MARGHNPGLMPDVSLQWVKEGVMQSFFKKMVSQAIAVVVSVLLVGGVVYWVL